ncbi:hypothetical protein LCGC14_1790400, partial [marine sediment metagenome]
CEDYAVFLATLYKAAGYRTAIVLLVMLLLFSIYLDIKKPMLA